MNADAIAPFAGASNQLHMINIARRIDRKLCNCCGVLGGEYYLEAKVHSAHSDSSLTHSSRRLEREATAKDASKPRH